MRKTELLATNVRPRPPTISLAREYATTGWIVEVVLADNPPDRRYFAVGGEDAKKAEEAVLRYPGIMVEDRRIARRLLSLDEISSLKLRTGAVRPYGSNVQSSRDA